MVVGQSGFCMLLCDASMPSRTAFRRPDLAAKWVCFMGGPRPAGKYAGLRDDAIEWNDRLQYWDAPLAVPADGLPAHCAANRAAVRCYGCCDIE